MSGGASSSDVISLVSASAPGKVILHGEHSVVYGKLALVRERALKKKTLFAPQCRGDFAPRAARRTDLHGLLLSVH